MYKRSLKKVIGLILFFVIIGSMATYATERKETIKVGYFDYHGFITKGINERFTGYGCDYLNEIAKYTDWEYEYIEGTWEECCERLKKGEIDLLCTAQYSEERAQVYDYSAYESGLEYAAMYVSKDNDAIFFEDFLGFNGIDVGLLTGSFQNELFDVYAEENNFEVNKIYYASTREMMEALNKGEVDAIVNGTLNNIASEKIVAKFAVMPFYFITTKGNDALMETLDDALKKIKNDKPYFNSFLHDKYYGRPSSTMIGLTREEAEYIKGNPTLKIACHAAGQPMEYFDEKTGEYKGLYADMLKLISDKSGIKFDFIETSSMAQSIEYIEEKQADALSSIYGETQKKEDSGILLTKPYINIRAVIIGKQGMQFEESNIKTVALSNTFQGINEFVEQRYPNCTLKRYDSVEACIKAVSNGEVDISVQYFNYIQNTFNDNKYKNVGIIETADLQIPMSLGISKSASPLLSSVLNKTISSITNKEVNDIILKNTISLPYKPSFEQILRQNIIIILMAIALASTCIIFVVKQEEERFRNMALIDELTGLWSSNRFKIEAEALLSRNKNKEYVLVSMDIDKFKYINESLSYAKGNEILKMFAEVLSKTVCTKGISARVAADNFLLLLEYSTQEHLIEQLQQFNLEVNHMKENQNTYSRLAVKSGAYVIHPKECTLSLLEIIDKANIARKMIKGLHKKHLAFYDNQLEAQIDLENYYESTMEQAIEDKEFQVYYQPKYDLYSERMIGAEALVRWQHPIKGLIAPSEFVPLFEKNGFIVELDFYVYEQVFETIKRWLEEGKKVVPISINVSRAHLSMGNFISRLMKLIKKYDIKTELIELELTESVFTDLSSNALELMEELKILKFQLSIDDFGSGYSSLNLLKDIPADILKIDRGFFDEKEDSERSGIIIKKVVELANEIGIKVICEGVETSIQAQYLKKIGCKMAQGYLFARPMPVSAFEKKL